MNLKDFFNNDGVVVKNPNKKSKKDGEPEFITVPATQNNSGNLYGDFNKAMDKQGYMFTDIDKPDKYEKYGVTIARPNLDTIDYELADHQSNWEKAWHAATQTVVNEIGLGTFRGFSDLADFVIGGAIRLATGEENDYSSPVSELIKSWQEKFEEYQPIYTTPGVNIANGGFSNFGWWMSNTPSIASSLTLLLPSTAFTKGVSLLGKATRLNKAIGSTRKFLTAIDKVDKATEAGKDIGKLGRISRWVNNENTVRRANDMFEMGVNGFTSRIMENYQEANQVYQDLLPTMYGGDSKAGITGIRDMSEDEYNQFIERNEQELNGVDTSDRKAVAKRIAKAAADRTFTIDMLNGFFDVYELYGLRNLKRFMNAPMRASIRRQHLNTIKYFGKSPAEIAELEKARSFISKATEKTKDALLGSTTAITAQLSEGVEEAINYIAQEEGMNYGNVLLGSKQDSPWDTRLQEYMNSPQLYESAFWGVLGGVVFQGAGSALAQARNAYEVKQDEKKRYKENPTTKEQIQKTPWSDAFELPEIKARKQDIEARAIADAQLRQQLSQIDQAINPFEKNPDGTPKLITSEEEKQIARDRAFNQRATNLLMNSMRVGNWDITRAYLESDEIRDKLVEAGVLTQEEALQRQEEAIRIADKIEEAYSRNIRAVGNAMRGKDDTTGADYSDVPYEYFQMIAIENTRHEIDAEQFTRNIEKYMPVVKSEEERLANELRDNGIDYKEAIRSFILAQQLGQVEAELEAARKTVKEGKTDYNIDARTLAGQSAIRELELRKRVLTNMINDSYRSHFVDNAENKNNKLADKIHRGATLLTTLRAVAATEADSSGGYKMNVASKRFEELDNAIVRAYNAETDDDYKSAKVELDKITPDFSDYSRDEFREAAHAADVFNENIGIALSQDGAIETLDNYSRSLLEAYATINYNEIAREIELAHIAKDREGIRTMAHNKHNNIMSVRGIALEQAFNVIKGIAKKYNEEISDIDKVLAYGTLNSTSRDILKNILTNDDMKTYDDAMRIIALNRKSVTGRKGETSAINSLLPEMIQDALYQSSRDEYSDYIEEDDNTQSQSYSTPQNAPQGTQNSSVENTPTPSSKPSTSKISGEISGEPIDFTKNTSGKQLSTPSAIISVNSEGYPIKLNQYSKDDADNNDVWLKPIDAENGEYELDFKKELDEETKDGTEELFNNPYLFKVTTPFINGGKLISNPTVVINPDGTVVEVRPGVIDNPDSVSGKETTEEENKKESSEESEEEGSPISSSTGEEKSTTSSEEVDPATFNEEESPESTENEYDINELKGDIQREMMTYAAELRNSGEDYDENALYDTLKEKYKDKVSEEKLKEEFNNNLAFGRRFAKRFKEHIKEFEDIADFIDTSYIVDTAIEADEAAKARKKLNSAFEKILDNFLVRSVADEYKGKKVISLENLLRYANEVAGDTMMGELLYDKFLKLLKKNEKYMLVEGYKPNRSDILEKATMSSEERFEKTNSPNGRSIDINYLLRGKTEEQKQEIYDIIDKLKPEDELYIQVVDNGKGVEFRKDGVALGRISIPKVTDSHYTMINNGWIVDIPKSNDGSKSKLEQLFIRIMINPNNEEKIKPIITAINTALYTKHYITDPETGKPIKNPEYDVNYENIIKIIRDAGINIDDYINLKDTTYTNFTLASYIVNIYKGVKDTSQQWLGKAGYSVEEYAKLIQERRAQSISNWFAKLKDSYSTALSLSKNDKLKIRVDTVNQGGLVITSEDEALPVNGDGVIGSNHKGKIDIAVASSDKVGHITLTNGTTIKIPAINVGSTFVTIPRNFGEPALVHAFPQNIGAVHFGKELQAIHKEVINEFNRLLSAWSNNPSSKATDIVTFIEKLCSTKGTNNPLFRGLKVTKLTGNFEGYQIEYNRAGRKQYIKLFDHNKYGDASVIKIEDDKPVAFKKEEVRKEVLDKFGKIISEVLTYNIGFEYVKGNRELKGFAKRNNKGEFIIQIPNGEKHTFKSYKDFIIENGVVAVTTKSSDGKSNFYRPGTSDNQYDKTRITYKVVDSTTSPVEERKQPKPTIPTIKKGDEIKTLIESKPTGINVGETIINSILDGTQLNILNNSKLFKELSFGNIIFVNNLQGAVAAHFGKDRKINGVTIPAGTIAVTKKWIDMLNSDDISLHEEAVRHLIHESIHRKIDTLSKKEQKELFNNIRTIFNEFVAANEKDGVRNQFSPFEYNTNKKDESKYYKNGEINDKGLEEFLVESITRPALIERLNSIATAGQKITNRKLGSIKSKNLFQKILSVISKLFGLNINKGSLLEKEYKLFTQVGLTSITKETKTNKEVKKNKPTETKVKENAEQLTLQFEEQDNKSTTTNSEETTKEASNISTTVEDVTIDSDDSIEFDDNEIDESKYSDTEVASLGQVRDTIIPENAETFERLVSKGAIQINC